MAICDYCGFDGHTPGEPCAVCGVGEETEVLDPSEARTLRPRDTPRPIDTAPAIFKDRYQIEQTIGRGGMGTVHRAIDRKTNEIVALKILHFSMSVEDTPFQRFQREVRILRRIDHPLIPRIHDAGLHGERMFLVTDLVEGVSIRDVIAKKGKFAPWDIVRIGSFIAEGLEVAHHSGVIHRDIKPHNVMLTSDGEVRLLDFGIARDVAKGAKSITDTGMLVGTPEYMAPEQFQGEKIDARSDIYSLGVMLFQMATGRLPFQAETPVALGMKHVSEPPPPPRTIVPDLPAGLNRIILKCLEKRREDRYPTASDLADDLRTAGEGRRHVRRLRCGDYLIEDDSDRSWEMVIASRSEKKWPEGSTLVMDGTYYRLGQRDYDEEMPAPWIYRFSFWPESEVIRKLIEYDPDQPQETGRSDSLLGRWFGKGDR